jgi:hypothetical protein
MSILFKLHQKIHLYIMLSIIVFGVHSCDFFKEETSTTSRSGTVTPTSINIQSNPSLDSADRKPPKGSTAVFVGADEASIRQYALHSSHQPHGFGLYTSLDDALGLDIPVDQGKGRQNGTGALAIPGFSKGGVLLFMELSANAQTILEGQRNQNIQAIKQWIHSQNNTVWLVPMPHSLQGLSNYSAASYKAVWAYIMTSILDGGKANIYTIWPADLFGGQNTTVAMDWFPADSLVDAIGTRWLNRSIVSINDQNKINIIATMAAEKQKPFVIYEAFPYGGLNTPDVWQKWFEPLLDWIELYNIALVHYVHADRDILPYWRNQGWGNARLTEFPLINTLWEQAMQDPRFKHN